MALMEVVTGDPVDRIVNLTKITDSGEVSFDIPIATDVTVALVSADRKRKLTGDSLLNNAAVGADWSISKVVVEIPKVETAAITEFGLAWLEIQVNDGGEITWYQKVRILEGHVD